MSLPFCPDPFFNYNITWYINATKWYAANSTGYAAPDLTECFKDTFLRWLPLVWLLVALLLGLPFLRRAQRPPHLVDTPISALQIVRMFFTLAFLGVSIADIVYSAIVSSYSWFPKASVVIILAPALESAMMVISVLFYIVEYRKLYFRNPAFFIFWLLESLVYLILTYTASLSLGINGYMLPAHAAFIYARWIIATAAFITTFFSQLNNLPGGRKPYPPERCVLVDVKPDVKKHKSKKAKEAAANALETADIEPEELPMKHKLRTPCPEEYVSHAGYLTYMWFLPLVIRGFRKALETSDLFLLREEETTVYNRNRFQRKWEEELKKWRAEMAAKEKSETESTDSDSNVTAYKFNPNMETTSRSSSIDVSVASTSNTQQPLNMEEEHAKREKQQKEKETKDQKEQDARPKPPLVKVLLKVYGPYMLFSQFIMIIYVFVYYLNPCLLWVFILFMNDPSNELWKGYVIAAMFFIAQLLQSMLYQQHFHLMIKASVRIRAALIDTLYRKSLTIAPSAMATSGTGDFVNFLAVDLQRLQDMLQYIYIIWFAPLNTVLSIVLLWFQIGWVCFVGLGMMGCGIMINFVLASVLRVIMGKVMLAKDKRVRFMTELLNGIKVIKLYAWEKAFSKIISGYRITEIKLFLQFFICHAGIMVLFMCLPFILTASTFLIYTHVHGDPVTDSDNQLTAVKAFMTLSLYNLLQVPLGFLPMIMNFLSAAMVGVNRVAAFLSYPDADPNSVLHVENEETIANPIIVENGEFMWKEKGEVILKGINLRVKKGEMVAVVGGVGSGKSSLVSALLGELVKQNGLINISTKKIAYVAQSAWIQNSSLKENILFGMPFDQQRYDETLEACALVSDLKVLPGGDSTEIGERGINLSGGQKQRVAVARAVYSDADLFLLDDPLSAVDVHVGKHLFEHVFGPQGLLAKRGATRVLITHGIHYLPKVDHIFCLADKTIREQGTFDELMEKNGHFAQLVKQFQSEEEAQEKKNDEEKAAVEEEGETTGNEQVATASSSDPTTSNEIMRERAESEAGRRHLSSAVDVAERPKKSEQSNKKSKLMTEEESATGSVSPRVYWWYIRAMTIPLGIIFIVFFAIFEGLQIFSNIWLSNMADDQQNIDDMKTLYYDNYSMQYIGNTLALLASSHSNNTNMINSLQSLNTTIANNFSATLNNFNNRRDYYLWWYLGYGGIQAGLVAIFSVTFSFMVASASRFIHIRMLDRLLHAPMSFFDTTPTGRILNRFSKDMDLIDFMMPMTFRGFFMMLGSIVAVFVVIAYTTPIFLAVLGPVLVIFLLLLFGYLPTSRQLRRLESVTRSPVFSHVAETISGRLTIMAFRASDRFIEDQSRRMDENHVYNLASFIANRFLGVCIDFANNILVVAACAFAVNGRDNESNPLPPGKAALSLSYAISISAVANMMIRMMNDFEVNAVSIERTKEYTTIPQEAEWEIEATKPQENWPDAGVIEFQDYSTRYREGLDLVLKKVNVKVASTEKVGICGRTGAGKSSVTLALFRLIEAANGKIIIDGLHAESLGLHHLRSRLTILPQEPVIFSQSLRFNLDPFDEHTDEEVWRSLELVHLKKHFSVPDEKSGKSKGLGFMVTEGGGNLSVGQRQLLCLSRALLRRTKVLVLDEATAAVDYETDALIQATIRSEFKDCTVLTIAHRINTIIDSDKILVLDRGRVREFDSPQNLLARGDSSVFFQMVQQAGSLNSALASSANHL